MYSPIISLPYSTSSTITRAPHRSFINLIHFPGQHVSNGTRQPTERLPKPCAILILLKRSPAPTLSSLVLLEHCHARPRPLSLDARLPCHLSRWRWYLTVGTCLLDVIVTSKSSLLRASYVKQKTRPQRIYGDLSEILLAHSRTSSPTFGPVKLDNGMLILRC